MRLKNCADLVVRAQFVDKLTHKCVYNGVVFIISDCHLVVDINGKIVAEVDLQNVQVKKPY